MSGFERPDVSEADHQRNMAMDAYIEGLLAECCPPNEYYTSERNAGIRRRLRDEMFVFLLDKEHALPSEYNPSWPADEIESWQNRRDAEALVHLTWFAMNQAS